MRINQVKLFNYNQVSFSSCYDRPEKESTLDDLLRKEGDPPKAYKSASEYIREAYNDPKRIKKIKNRDFESINLMENYKRTHLPLPIVPVKKNCYRGEALLYTPKRLTPLKRKGVTTVIDLAKLPDYDILCELKGFDYYAFPIFLTYRDNPPFVTREEYAKTHKIPNTRLPDDSEEFAYDNIAREFIDKFKEFVSVINKGNFYICCNHGKLRTDAALLMNQYFNPKWDGDKSLKPDDEQLEKFRIFYGNLTKRDKRDLGFTEEFEKDLCQKLGIGLID